MNKVRKEFYRNFIDENSGDQNKLFRASQCLFNRTVDDGLPPNLDSRTFSNDLGKYFRDKIDTIRMQLDTDQQTDSYQVDDTPSVAQQTDLLPEYDTPLLFLMRLIHFQKMTLCLVFLMSLCHHSVLLRCYQFEMLNSLSRTPPLNPVLLTLCHPHWLANVRISSQF